MAKKAQVKFRLFEKNGSIRIAIQTIPGQEEKNSKLNTSAEYYIASDPRNVSKILDTLVSTVKDVSISGDNLCTNYRRHDTFIIEDYEKLKNHPELRPFFDKMGGKIKQQEAKNKKNTPKPSGKRKNIRTGKKILIAASFFVGTIITGLFKSDMMAQESVPDTLIADNTDQNSEDEIQKVLEEYQASIVVMQPNIYENIEIGKMEEKETTAVVETVYEEEVIEEKIEEDSQIVEESTDTIPEVTGEGNQDSEEESHDSKEEEKDKEDEKESTDEITLAEAELDEEVEKIAANLIAENKTSEQDVKEAATIALQDGQAPVEVAQVQEESTLQKESTIQVQTETAAQVVTEPATDIITPVMNTEGSGINYIETYHLTPQQIDIIKATIQHEAGFNPVEVEKVASTVINRCESGIWPGGTNPYGVIVGKGQFQSYYAGYYKKYLNGNYADYTDQIVDAMLRGEQVPSHDFERFASGSSATGTQFTKGGNKYR